MAQPFNLAEVWDTKNNLEAEGRGILKPKTSVSTVIDHEAEFGQMPKDPGDTESNAPGTTSVMEDEVDCDDCGLDDGQLMALIKSAHSQGVSYQTTVLQPRWNASYNAYNNKHPADSKYSSARFRGRTKLFRPKTRSTTRKKAADAAAALFSTSDVVIVSAQQPGDQKQAASAAVVHELLNYRLDRTAANAGIPWFMISMGAHLTAQQTGVCVSKQYWEFKKEHIGYEDVPLVINGQNLGTQRKKKFRIVRDRPRIRLYPPEDVIRDPAAAWDDQAHDSSYIILKNGMALGEAREFINNANEQSAIIFLEVSDEVLYASAGVTQQDSGAAANVRRQREQSGNDRYNDTNIAKEFRTVWLHENFIRLSGRDFVFWTLGADTLISNVVPVAKAYPEQGGTRPIAIGVSAIEPFKIDPMSPIESWQPLQQEINDTVNLTLDTMKQSISPLTLVRRGRSVDIRAIQNRSPDSVAYVQDKDDVTFDRPDGVGNDAYASMERLNADFDDQAGNFSQGSVQTNRSLNDTVGGMKLMNGAANALGEFDLRIWIETWVESCLRQLVKLEQYYENDPKVLAIAGAKAELFQKFGIDEITDEMLMSEVTTIVNVGLGSADPMQALQKFQQATAIAGGIIGPSLMQDVKRDAVLNEVFGKAGYKDAASRFFNKPANEDPRIQQAQQVIQRQQAALDEANKALTDKTGEIQSKQSTADKDRASKEKIAKLNVVAGLAKQESVQAHGMKSAALGHIHDENAAESDRNFQMQQSQAGNMMPMGEGGEEDVEAQAMQIINGMEEARAVAGIQQMKVVAQAIQQSNEALLKGMQQLMQGMVMGFSKLAEDRPGEAMLQGFEALIAKMDGIGQDVTATMERIAAAPREIIRGKDDRATGVKLNIGAA